MRYFDASALVKRYIDEPDSGAVAGWLEAPAATSRLSAVEVSSAIIRRAREGGMPVPERDRALEGFNRDLAELLLVELSADVTSLATGILTRNNLRAADAVHLASCLTLRYELGADVAFVAFDARLQAAARYEGLWVEP